MPEICRALPNRQSRLKDKLLSFSRPTPRSYTVPQYSPAVVYGTPIAPYPGYSGWETAAAFSAISFGVRDLAVGAALGGGGWGWGWNHWGADWHGEYGLNFSTAMLICFTEQHLCQSKHGRIPWKHRQS